MPRRADPSIYTTVLPEQRKSYVRTVLARSFSTNLCKRLAACGISSKELAHRTGIGASSLSMYAHGDRLPSLEALVTLAAILGTTPNDLLGYKRHPLRSAKHEVSNDADIIKPKEGSYV